MPSFGTPFMYLPTNLKELLHCKNIQKTWMQSIPIRHTVLHENKLSIFNPLIPAGLYQNYFHTRLKKKKSKITALSICPSEKCIFNCRFTVFLCIHSGFFSVLRNSNRLWCGWPLFPTLPYSFWAIGFASGSKLSWMTPDTTQVRVLEVYVWYL